MSIIETLRLGRSTSGPVRSEHEHEQEHEQTMARATDAGPTKGSECTPTPAR